MTTLLVDADLLVYRYASVHQHAVPWDPDTWSYYADLSGAKSAFGSWLAWLESFLQADRTVLIVSDTEANWRHDVLPSYKGHRVGWGHGAELGSGGLPPKPGPARPMLHKPLREWLLNERGARMISSLEGDDLLGMMSTAPGGTDTIMVSMDKDLRTVPGRLFNPDKGMDGVVEISELEADRFHMLQTLMGDSVDGYSGCKGIGPVKAERLLDPQDPDSWWPTIVATYEKAGLTEADALVQARVARVLRHGEYNVETKEVTLWRP